MPKELKTAWIAGLLSSSLFLVVFGIGLSFVFIFLPTLPLFSMGLSRQPEKTHVAIFVAAAIIAVIAGISAALLYLVFMAWPAWYMSKKCITSQLARDGKTQLWYPIGTIIINLTVGACAFAALMTAYYSLHGGIQEILSENIHEAFADLQDDYGDIIDSMASGWSFLMFPVTIWLWGIILYGHAWLANRALIRKKQEQRPDLVVHTFTIPSWMLTLLAICALASLIGSPSMSFLGKATLLSLMLPYFFLGASLMHQTTKTWPNGRFFTFFVYLMVFTQFWPGLILAGMGLWHQLKNLNKHLSEPGSSSKN